MKVVYLLGKLERGGTETLIYDIFSNHSKTNFNLSAVYRKDGNLTDNFLSTGITLHKLQPKHKLDLMYFIKLRKLIKKKKADIVHTHQTLDTFFAILASVFLKTKVVWTIHFHTLKFSFLSNLMFKFICRMSDKIIFVSKTQQTHFLQSHKFIKVSKSSIIHNGISMSKLHTEVKSDIRTELNIPAENLLIGSVGNFNIVRDQFQICKFLKLFNAQSINYSFLFVGGIDKNEPWRYKQCEEFCIKNNLKNVFFLGTRNDVPSILKQLDAFVYSSEHDTFGIAVIEAIASGIPVFVNDWKVMLEITQNGKFANIYKSKNEQSLFDSFNIFLANKNKENFKVKMAAKEIQELYNIETHVTNLKQVYSSLLTPVFS
ncbi:MAG: glycosyltransferase family 4 protein [Bacteroidales bacterium]|nr:glycosyltransferase family 4 protein [Bacteroidales bacterium]